MMPVIAFNLLQSIDLLTTASEHLATKCLDATKHLSGKKVEGVTEIEADPDRCKELIEQSLAMCTALAPRIGYDSAAALAKLAYKNGTNVRQVALEQVAGHSVEEVTKALGLSDHPSILTKLGVPTKDEVEAMLDPHGQTVPRDGRGQQRRGLTEGKRRSIDANVSGGTMIEERPDDSMVEISDIDEEPTPSIAEPPPRVVIEYRDRGIPWMLVPPLLALSAVIAAVVVYNINAKLNHRRPTVAAVDASKAALDPAPTAALTPLADAPLGSVPSPTPPANVAEQIPVENPPGRPQTPEPSKTVADLSTMIAAPDPSNTLANASPSDPASTTFPKVAALGFDPSAIGTAPMSADPSAAAPVDRDLAPVVPPDQPSQVDPDLLPPDPRKARVDRRRRALEDRRRAEAERFQFLAELKAITKQLGQRSAPRIHELVQAYGVEIPPTAHEQAKKALGKTGVYAGAGTTERINLLRRLGFPEPAILNDVYDMESRHQSNLARNAPTEDELYVRSALILLNHPPTRPSTSARTASTPRGESGARPTLPADPDGGTPDANQ